MAVRPVPEGFHTVTPYLTVHGATELLQFLKDAFLAQETECMRSPDGRVQHAEVQVGDSRIMLGEAKQKHPPRPSTLYLYVDDVDLWVQRAVAACGQVLEELEDKFYGDRTGAVSGPAGNHYYMATHMEDLDPAELERRALLEMGDSDAAP